MTTLLGGALRPLGSSVQFVEADRDTVLEDLVTWRRELGQHVEVGEERPYESALHALLPFEAPWTRELVLASGNWTAYLNNAVDGGDSTASAQVMARRLGVRHVAATHMDSFGPGHAATHFGLSGPGGEPPLMGIRSIATGAQDGRWYWYESGSPLPFEETSRYRARRKRDRFDRAVLLTYLEALGIPAGEDSAYGSGVLVQQRPDWTPGRVEDLAGSRAWLGWDDE